MAKNTANCHKNQPVVTRIYIKNVAFLGELINISIL